MSLQTLDLNLLKTFDALMRERSVTRAAVRLSLTQPAVSGMLNRLRDRFDDPLFVRTPRGVEPTPRALELAEPVRRVLADVEALMEPTVFDPATAEIKVSIAATDYALRVVLVPFLEQLRLQAPGVRVAMLSVGDGMLAAPLEHGDIDLALLTPQTAPDGLYSRRLFDEHYVCAMREDHPAAHESPLTLERLCTLHHAIVSLSGGGFSGATDAALAQMGRQRHVAVSVPGFGMLLDILLHSDLVALVPQRLAAATRGLALFEPPLHIEGFTKLAVWHERTHRSAAHRWLRDLLYETCERGPRLDTAQSITRR